MNFDNFIVIDVRENSAAGYPGTLFKTFVRQALCLVEHRKYTSFEFMTNDGDHVIGVYLHCIPNTIYMVCNVDEKTDLGMEAAVDEFVKFMLSNDNDWLVIKLDRCDNIMLPAETEHFEIMSKGYCIVRKYGKNMTVYYHIEDCSDPHNMRHPIILKIDDIVPLKGPEYFKLNDENFEDTIQKYTYVNL